MQNSHRWDAQLGRWECESNCSRATAELCDDIMAAQYADTGFLVLRQLLPPAVVDMMAGRTNEYIASRGRFVREYEGGYLLAGISRDRALAPLFEWVHTSSRLHAALRRVWHGGGRHEGSAGGRSDAGGQGYRWVSRNEVSVDRWTNWHVDGFGYEDRCAARR